MDNILDFISHPITVICTGIICFMIFVSGLSVYLHMYSMSRACELYRVSSEREVKFVRDFPWWWKCLVKTESGWIEYDNLKTIETPDLI